MDAFKKTQKTKQFVALFTDRSNSNHFCFWSFVASDYKWNSTDIQQEKWFNLNIILNTIF